MGFYRYPAYVSVAEKRAKAEKKLKQLKKKNPEIKPVIIEGRSLATTWWGKEWNKNLERYADYSNRIERGRSYVRHMAVLDLDVNPGHVSALVQGSASRPYEVSITIKPISAIKWNTIIKTAKGELDSLQKLLAGKFPKELASLFTQMGDGLFPSPKEINFDCSCPDWASMCKHIAAALYGIGARLDEDPLLFFTLRNVNVKDLISETVRQSKTDLLSKAKQKTKKVMDTDDDLSDLFGIDLDETTKPSASKKKTLPKKTKPRQKKKVSIKQQSTTPYDIRTEIEKLIKKHKNGIKVKDIINITGHDTPIVRRTLARLKKLEKIESVGWGIYRAG